MDERAAIYHTDVAISDLATKAHQYKMTDSNEIPVMVAIQRSDSKPKFSCILVDRGKKFSMLYQCSALFLFDT